MLIQTLRDNRSCIAYLSNTKQPQNMTERASKSIWEKPFDT
jgi:hypothetical protein